MSAAVLAWLLSGAAVAGALLLALGVRGRKVSDHTHCRRCAFDLVGLDAPALCPECGAALDKARAVRRGLRRRRRSFVLVGSLLLLGAAGVGGTAGWTAAKSFNWNTIKPLWMLEREIAVGSQAAAAAAIEELLRRCLRGDLPDAKFDSLVERALAAVDGPDHSWIREWGDVIEARWSQRRLTDDQRDRYVKNSVRHALQVRRVVRAEDPLRIEVGHYWGRYGTKNWFYQVRLVTEVEWLELAGVKSMNGPVAETVSGRTNAVGEFRHGSVSHDAPPGEHVVTVRLRVRAYLLSGTLSFWESEDSFESEPFLDWTEELSTKTTVLAPGESDVTLVDDPSLAPLVHAAITIDGVTSTVGNDGAVVLRARAHWSSLPARLGHQANFRTTHGLVPAGRATSGNLGAYFEATLPEEWEPPTAVDLVLTPDPEVARRILWLTEIWNHELVFEDLPVRPAAID